MGGVVGVYFQVQCVRLRVRVIFGFQEGVCVLMCYGLVSFCGLQQNLELFGLGWEWESVCIGIRVYVFVCVRERVREVGKESECVFWEQLDFILRFGFFKIFFCVEIVFLDEMMVIIIIMCYLSKIKIWYSCLFFQLIFFYLCVKFLNLRFIDILEKS